MSTVNPAENLLMSTAKRPRQETEQQVRAMVMFYKKSKRNYGNTRVQEQHVRLYLASLIYRTTTAGNKVECSLPLARAHEAAHALGPGLCWYALRPSICSAFAMPHEWLAPYGRLKALQKQLNNARSQAPLAPSAGVRSIVAANPETDIVLARFSPMLEGV